MAIDGALTMKRVLRFSVGLLVNVFILFILVKVFAFGFGFAYDVFASNSCKDKADTKVVAVTILPDSSIKDVCETLDDAGRDHNRDNGWQAGREGEKSRKQKGRKGKR